MPIERHELLPLLVRVCPGLRERLVASVEDWLQADGAISDFRIVGQLEQLVVERFNVGDYDFSDALFALVDRLLLDGSEYIQAVVATGFLEGMAAQNQLVAELWIPLLGPAARSYLQEWDRFLGVSTSGLDGPVAPTISGGQQDA